MKILLVKKYIDYNILMENKVLMVSIVGFPNVGKSTFINSLLCEKISITSNKPNTTQENVIGVYSHNNVQIVFTDTPGIGIKNTKQDKKLRKIALQSMNNNDLTIFIFDSSKKLPANLIYYSEYVKNKIAILNKIDTIKKSRALPLAEELSNSFNKVFFISALKKDGLEQIKEYLINQCKPGDFPYDVNVKSNLSTYKIFTELAREVLLDILENEVPYKIYVTNESIEEKNNVMHVSQNIWILPKYKHILLGKIKEISMAIRKNIASYTRKKVVNKVHIKIKKK